ncbi:MAG: hypothetical protein ACRDIB_17080 [Ardenticatenaceae bacterium]
MIGQSRSPSDAARWLPLCAALFVFVLAFVSPISYAGSDSHFTLLVSQALLEYQTFALDAYRDAAPAQFEAFAYQLLHNDGHVYYSYPIGTPIFAAPLVSLLNLLGYDMVNTAHNYLLQNLLSALLSALSFYFIYKIGRCYLSRRASLLITTISLLGSVLISAMATALWSLDFAVVLMLASLYLLARYDGGRDRAGAAYPLGALLFLAYLARPTAAIFIAGLLLYLFLRVRATLLKVVVTLVLLFTTFAALSWLQYQSFLPPYYSTSKWFGTAGAAPLTALLGLLVSPSRGLFIYSPFVLVVLFGGLLLLHHRPVPTLLWISYGWFFTHLFTVAGTAMWWGGYSFGPRLLADALPAVVMITILAWRGRFTLTPRWRHAGALVYLALGAWSIWVHSYQGLWNVHTVLWNARPSVDAYPAYLFDWEYPQFLASAESLHQRYYEHVSKALRQGNLELEPYPFGEPLIFEQDGQSAFFFGWWRAPDGLLWSETRRPRILFKVGDVNEGQSYHLKIEAHTLHPQEVTVRLNGALLGTLSLDGNPPQQLLPLEGQLLKASDINLLEFHVSNPSRPPLAPIRHLGPAIYLHNVGISLDALHIISSQ